MLSSLMLDKPGVSFLSFSIIFVAMKIFMNSMGHNNGHKYLKWRGRVRAHLNLLNRTIFTEIRLGRMSFFNTFSLWAIENFP